MKSLIVLAGFIGLHLLFTTAVAQTPAGTIPQFTFTTSTKTLFTEKNLVRGAKIFFLFFDTQCDHCQHACEKLNGYNNELVALNFYLVTLDKPQTANSFLQKHAPKFFARKNVQLLFDTNNEFITRFTPKKYPSMFLYSSEHKLIMYSDDESEVDLLIQKMK